MSSCPCCSSPLLRHWKQNEIYWYCLSCRQEMPNFEIIIKSHQIKSFYQLFYSRVPLVLVNCYQQAPQELKARLPLYQKIAFKEIV